MFVQSLWPSLPREREREGGNNPGIQPIDFVQLTDLRLFDQVQFIVHTLTHSMYGRSILRYIFLEPPMGALF